MNDPFASLDPIQKPKTAAERVLTAPVYNHPPPGAPVSASLHGGGGMDMHMGMGMGMGAMAPPGMGMHMNMGNGMGGNNGMGMGGNGMMNMGGMNPGMGGMGMGMNPGMGMNMGQQHQQHQQQNPFQQQQPVMYDNIKNLLQQKPKVSAAFEDSASMDFLENLGGGGSTTSSSTAKTNSGSFPAFNPQVRAAEPTSAVANPFGSSFSPVSPSMGSGGDMGLSIFETGKTAASSSSSVASPSGGGGGSKSSALADRLANGRRKTQEVQRSQLQLNANSFGAGGSAVPKISLKEMAGQPSSKHEKSSSDMSLDDFSSTGSSSTTTQKMNSFGDSDPFGGGSFGPSSAAAAPRQASFGGHHDAVSGPKPVDENDNTFW